MKFGTHITIGAGLRLTEDCLGIQDILATVSGNPVFSLQSEHRHESNPNKLEPCTFTGSGRQGSEAVLTSMQDAGA